MIVLKIILWAVAIFTTLQFLMNIISDLNDVKNKSMMYSTPESLKEINERAMARAKLRIVLSAMMSISWALIIML